VQLAADEWASGGFMEKARDEYFAQYPESTHPLMVVTVHEHGGWWLQYMRDGTIVGTANDAAVLSVKATAFRELVKRIELQYLPTIRRGE
jgi:hypothetical protein